MNITTSRRIAAHYIYYRRSLLRNPILSLASDGTVTGIEFCDSPDSREGVEFYSGIVIPGLTNAHCHLELSYLGGQIPEGGGFVAFADGLAAVRNKFSAGERVRAIERADRELWQSGTAVVGDICNGSSTFAIKAAGAIRYHSFLELYGLSASPDALVAVASEAAAGIGWSVTPHSTYSLGGEAFAAAIAGLPGQREGAPLSIHFMESLAEVELFEGRGDMAKWYAGRGFDTDFRGFRSPADRITEQVPPDRDIMLIHNCYATEEVVDKIHSHFTGRVTWVLCPRSNRFISGIEPPYSMLRRKGAHIAVGTDSLATNHSLSLLEELKLLRNVPLVEMLGWAVENGTEALGVAAEYGGFEVGKRCGAVLLTGIDWDTMSLTPASECTRIV